ncbi:hypothetical protein UT300012_24520 [Paraclostridium bifermentans]
MGFKFNIMPKRYTVNSSELQINDILIDVRSEEEFITGSITEHNVPILRQEDRGFCYRYTPLVFLVIGNGLYKNRESLCDYINEVALNEKKNRVVIACSRGRLRSPITWLYLSIKYPELEFKVLRGGIKGYISALGSLNRFNLGR